MATQSFTATIKGWSDRQQRNMLGIAQTAMQTTFGKMTTPQPGVSHSGGTFQEGMVPLDTGFLLGTAFLEINGTQTATGTVAGEASKPPDFAMGLAGMKLGDTAVGAFSAPYGRFVEYGTDKMAGRFFVRTAAQGWGQAVADAARKFK